MVKQSLRVGSRVRVPWGVAEMVDGTVVEVWGDPPQHVRVQLHFPDPEDDAEAPVLLLRPSLLEVA